MYRVCAAGAFLLAILALSSGCGSQVDSAAFSAGISPVQQTQQVSEQGGKQSSGLSCPTSSLLNVLPMASPLNSKWYADQD